MRPQSCTCMLTPTKGFPVCQTSDAWWQCRCQFNAAHRPACSFTLDKFSRASGLAQITRTPDSSVRFVSCGIYMDGTIVNSTTCFQVGVPMHVPHVP